MSENKIDQARNYLLNQMRGHFTDKTFSRYIQGKLAGDFAVEVASRITALEAENAELRERVWIPCSERLPEINQPVVCINVNEFECVSGDFDRCRQDCVYLSDFGHKYWSKYGGMGVVLGAYTHWMPLPKTPKQEATDE